MEAFILYDTVKVRIFVLEGEPLFTSQDIAKHVGLGYNEKLVSFEEAQLKAAYEG